LLILNITEKFITDVLVVPARADRRRKPPSAIDLGATESLDATLGDEAKSRAALRLYGDQFRLGKNYYSAF
jgi:hypothetical protein